MKSGENPRKAIHFAIGVVGWFFLQTIYCTIVGTFRNTAFFFASVPINVIAILIFFFMKSRWIAFGAGIAFSFNIIGLISMGILGMIDDEAIVATCILFPPFILLFTNWLEWLR
jgi:hypothetical protein